MSTPTDSPAIGPEDELSADGSLVAGEGVAETEPEQVFPARQTLLKRLADVVCLPETRVNAFERAVTADLLVEMLREAQKGERLRVARRLCKLSEVPHTLVRLLITDEPEIARFLIEDCESLAETDLLFCIRRATPAHLRLMAARKHIGPVVAEALTDTGDIDAIECLLKNRTATLSQGAIETAVSMSQDAPRLVPLLIRRLELRPSSAYVMFWWADAEVRKVILGRFAVNREVMQDSAGDVFAMAAKEGWGDPLSRKALQFIERRQRNREALKKSPFESLEAAIIEAARNGMTRHTAEEISYLSGLKPSTGAKIMRDRGGEGLAVLCKATGLKKTDLRNLWRALRRPGQKDGEVHPDLERVLIVYDTLAVDRAQTVLRYWNWSLSSALTPMMIRAISQGEAMETDALSVPQRAAMLAFAQDLKR
ncbi:DUF2336 domain-containing protein [Asticcacaulis sp. AND118]|uniref:DUF2336 domain-containing protein n=1 Tax=Asticcacaulis sp. AND118 TaxID=2840468 RepID=UPI001CFFBF09|nr:DUF2336 domain-containing protein [Asticcacaulis sp. AND118]UDF03986.1 DUF2336 domain-containing protein [Asticcacaulis sp. AND118]